MCNLRVTGSDGGVGGMCQPRGCACGSNRAKKWRRVERQKRREEADAGGKREHGENKRDMAMYCVVTMGMLDSKSLAKLACVNRYWSNAHHLCASVDLTRCVVHDRVLKKVPVRNAKVLLVKNAWGVTDEGLATIGTNEGSLSKLR